MTTSLAVVVLVFSGYGALVPPSVRCSLPGAVACPGGLLGPSLAPHAAGVQWFNVTEYDYGFWIIDSSNGANESASWNIFEGFKVMVNSTSLPPDPSYSGTNEHGLGILIGSNLVLNQASPVGSWAAGSFVAPNTPSTGNEVYCTIFCGPGHEGMRANIVDVVPPTAQAVATGSPTSGSIPLLVSFTGSAIGGSPPYTYAWSFGDGSPTSALQSPAHTYTAAGPYTAVLTVHDSTGAVSTAQVQITANPPGALNVTLKAQPGSGGVPLTVVFNGSATGGATPYNYTWAFGDGSIGTGAAVVHTYSLVGDYSASLTVVDASGTKATQVTRIAVQASTPPLPVTISTQPNSGTAPLNVTFTAKPGGGVPPYKATWDFGDGSTGSGLVTTHEFTIAGSFKATVTVTDSNGTTGSASGYVNVSGGNAVPLSVTVSTNVTTGPAPLPVSAFASITGGSGTYASVSWTLGDGSVGSGLSVQHTYLHPGVYTLVATVTDSGGNLTRNSTVITVTGLSLTVSLNANIGDAPFTVNATASVFGGDGHYSPVDWSWGDGTASVGAAASHEYNLTSLGNFTVRASVMDAAGNTATRAVSILILPQDVASIQAQIESRWAPTQVLLSLIPAPQSDINSTNAQWDFGNGIDQTAPFNTSVTYIHPGSFVVTARTRDALGFWTVARVELKIPAPPPPGGAVAGSDSRSSSWFGSGAGNPSEDAFGLIFLVSLGLLYMLVTGPRVRSKEKEPVPRPPRKLYMPPRRSSEVPSERPDEKK